METAGSNDSKDDKTSTKEASPKAPANTKAQSIAELMFHNDAIAERQHWTIWERDKEDEASENGKSSKKKIHVPLSLPKLETTPEVTNAEPAEKTETADSSSEPVDDVAEVDETGIGELEPDEARAIAEQYANGRSAELRDEQAELPSDSPEQAAVAANAAMIQKLAQKLRAEPEGDPGQAITEAADEVIAEEDLGTSEHVPAMPPDAEAPMPADEAEPPAGVPPGGSPPPRHPFGPGYSGGPEGGGVNPNVAPGASSRNTNLNTWGGANITPIEAQYYARQAENRGLLVGGIVGYLIGRRRGRIKTEKRLLPVQKKLEKAVTSLHTSIADREQQIRILAAEKARARQASRETVSRPPEAVRTAELAKAPVSAELVQRFEAVPVPIPSALTEAQPAPRPPERSPEVQVERMTQVELLKTAETVVIEGASLRQIYESHRITEKGLRHVLTEYLKGGEFKKALDQELTLKELTYERDPRLRHSLSAPESLADSKSGDGTSNESNLQPRQPFSAEPTPASSGNDTPAATSSSPKSPAANTLLQGTLMRAWVVLIVILVILVVILLFR